MLFGWFNNLFFHTVCNQTGEMVLVVVGLSNPHMDGHGVIAYFGRN